MARVVNSRSRRLLLASLIAFGVLFGRATWIATVRASSLSSFAQAQTKATVALPAGRGTIFDAMGTPLALGEQATTVYVDPHEITRPRAEANTAARVLGLTPKAVLSALKTPDTHFVYIARKASPKLASALARRKLPGFHFYGEERRSYPQGALASQVLGYAGVDNKGLSGLELELDPQLTGTPGSQTVVRDPSGRPIAIQGVTPAREGKAAFLTLDHTIQANAEQVLRATVRQWQAKSATAIVLDPKTGGVLALAMQPGYDANQVATKGLQGDAAVSDVFEPGSVFKVVTIGGALSQHNITPRTAFTLPYSIHVADRVIHDAEIRPTERMTVSQILQRSSNVGAITIAERYLGETGLKKWMARFGFGRKTGIDLPGESPGILPSYWSGSTIGNVPIGQGVSVTAIQLASVYAAIANGGFEAAASRRPRAGEKRRHPPSILRGGVDRRFCDAAWRRLGRRHRRCARFPGTVAGKTGTAQKPSRALRQASTS